MRGFFLRSLVMALCLLLAFLAGALAMHFGMHAGQHQQILDLQARVDTLQAASAEAQTRVTTLQGQLDVEAATRSTLEATLARQQQDLGQARDQLAFYEQLIPPAPAGAVAIRAFDVRRQGDFLRYRVLLTRNAPGQEAFNGRMRFMATPRAGGEAAKIQLAAASAQAAPDLTAGTQSAAAEPADRPPADPFVLDFQQFQRSTGVLQLPPGVDLRSVTLQVLEGGVIRATRDAPVEGAAQAEGHAPGVQP